MAAVATQARWPDWTKDRGQFVPHASTWLNQGRWQDSEPKAGSGQGAETRSGGRGGAQASIYDDADEFEAMLIRSGLDHGPEDDDA